MTGKSVAKTLHQEQMLHQQEEQKNNTEQSAVRREFDPSGNHDGTNFQMLKRKLSVPDLFQKTLS